jgi:cysteinyl-tRNA synthetase
MDNDFNSAEALGSVFKLCDLIFELNGQSNVSSNIWAQTTSLFEELAIDVLGLNVQYEIPEEVQKTAKEIQDAREKGDFANADKKRNKLEKMGYIVSNTATGTTVMVTSGTSYSFTDQNKSLGIKNL